MSNMLRFRGYSDDCFVCEIDNIIQDDVGYTQEGKYTGMYELCDNSRGVTLLYKIYDPQTQLGMIVTGKYLGVWVIGISPLDEDLPLPDWSMDWGAEGYSTIMTVEVPSRVSVECAKLNDSWELVSPKWSENDS